MNKDEFTISESHLQVDDHHTLWVHDWGNPDANTTFIHLQGGPGGATGESKKQLFDPKQHRVIFFDQRGAGQSLPAGSTENNTTDHLIDDIIKIADHHKIESFVLVGSSWGSCLALACALKHPKRVKSLILGGIFTGSQRDIDFIDQGIARYWYPDVWDSYLCRTPADKHDNPSAFHYDAMASKDEEFRKKSAFAYSELEGSILSIDDRHTPQDYDELDPSALEIELHYLGNTCFMPDNYIMDNAHKLTMPVQLIQGRYDMVCPPIIAYELHQRLPNGKLMWTTAGHRLSDRSNYEVFRAVLLQFD